MSDIFCLTSPDGKLLSPSIQSTVLAKYSRSPLSAKEILSKITAEEADKFNGKWVINYGHNSVAELATVPVCMEGISIVASKFIETVQRAAYSEKSTRYQKFSGESFIVPPGAPPSMKAFAKRFYDCYDKLYEPMIKRCLVLMGRDPDDPKSVDSVVRARAFDSLRYLLPAGTGTNVACVMNFRDARDLVRKLLGHSNPELSEIGQKMLAALSEIGPVLMRHTEPDIFEPKIRSLGPFSDFSHGWGVTLLTEIGEKTVGDLKQLVQHRYGMDWDMFSKHMQARPDHDEVPDIFKTVNLSFDMVMDFGAFRDLQRHRRCDQFVEPLTTQYGFATPDDIAGSELEPEYVQTMESVLSYEDDVMNDSDLSQYVIPLGYLHRSVFQMSLKELYYLVELRTKPHGHISYRRVSYKMFELANEALGPLMQWCRAVPPTDIGQHA